jgi:hypothetical protein
MSSRRSDRRLEMRSSWQRGIMTLASAFLLAAGATGFVAGCGGSRGIDTKILSDGTTTRTLANNEVKLEGAMKYYGSGERDYVIERQCYLDYRARETASGETMYEIVLAYIGVEELGIEPGRSLEFEADLNTYVLTAEGPGKRQRDPTGKSFKETLVYPVESERLMKLSEAASVRVTINGRAGAVKGSFDGENFSNLRSFVAECVRPAAGSPTQK